MPESGDDHRQADAELLHQLTQLLLPVEAVLWLTTPDKDGISYVSPRVERALGVTALELQRRPSLLLDIVHSEDRAALRDAMTDPSKYDWERRYRIMHPDGLRWVLARAFPVFDRAGKLVRIAGITEDVTADVEAEAALARSRRRFDALTEHSGVGIWEIDRQGMTTYVNRAMCEQLELDDPEQLRGQTYHEFFTPESLLTMRREHAQRSNGISSSYQVDLIGKRGGLRHAMVNGAPILDDQGAVIGLIGTFSDVTEVRRLEQALGQSQKLEAIGQLAAGVAHDFNNLLIPILGYSELAIETLGPGEVADDLRAVLQAAEQAKELTAQLLSFARKQALDMRPLALKSEVASFAPVLRRMLREDVTLELASDESDDTIIGDATQIRQVLLNLVSNAQDAMPRGGRLVVGVRSSTLGVDPEQEGEAPVPAGRYVELQVSDTGVGMDRATQARIFEPFFTTKSAESGTGLGLAMVYGCVRQHGGHVRCSSQRDVGSTFTLLFPALEGGSPALTPAASPLPPASMNSTILLVEDQEGVRSLLARVLLSEGYSVVQAADGREALERVQDMRGAVGLLVSDVVMPNMGGYELLERLRQDNQQVRALFLSGYSEHGSGDQRPRPRAHFLPKPFTVEALKRLVRELLAS